MYPYLTTRSGKSIVNIVSKITEKDVLDSIEKLTIRIGDLIEKCNQLDNKNQLLNKENKHLLETHNSTLEKNNLAKNKAEAILERLRNLEGSA